MATTPKQSKRKKCGAKTRNGGTCQRYGMQNGRCDKHGGKALKGAGHPAFKHGRRSIYLPTRMLEDAMRAWEDPELHSLREDIVTVDARVSDLQRRVDTGESGARWKELRTALKERRKSEARKDAEEAAYWQYQMDTLISDGAADYDAWEELVQMIDKRTQLVDREQRRQQVNHEMISADRALAMFASLIHVIRETVHDPYALSEISRQASRIMGSPDVIDIDAIAKLGPGNAREQ